MKTYITLIYLLLFSAFAKAQDTTKVEIPKIYVKAYQGTATPISHTSLRLVQVLQDSRCPKGVECIWAGNAKVEVEITNDKGDKITKQVTLSGKQLPAIYTEDGLEIYIRGLAPYPTTGSKINPSDYYLRVEVKN